MPKHGNFKHGMSFCGPTPSHLYRIWDSMKGRCCRKSFDSYKYYGTKGINVCEEWKNNFISFYNWAMDNGWKKGLQIDRINSFDNYSPENCRIITCAENIRNKKSTKLNFKKISLIKLFKNSGFTQKEIGLIFDINQSNVSRILNGKRWGII